jgi:hypothetical protein
VPVMAIDWIHVVCLHAEYSVADESYESHD